MKISKINLALNTFSSVCFFICSCIHIYLAVSTEKKLYYFPGIMCIACFVIFAYIAERNRKIITISGNSNDYIKFVKKTDTAKLLRKEPTYAKDKWFGNKALCKTDLNAITSRNCIHDDLEKKYSLSKIAAGNTDFERTLKLLEWMTDNTCYCGMQYKTVTDNSLDILDFSFGKSFENAINCRDKAIAFADCLVAVGIKAYPVSLLSLSFRNSHFICHVYLKEIDKWCAFDPSFGCYFTNEKGSLLDVFEIRDMFISEKKPTVCGYNFNGTTECFDVYMNGFLKLCISNISTWDDNSLNNRDGMKKRFMSKVPNLNNKQIY